MTKINIKYGMQVLGMGGFIFLLNYCTKVKTCALAYTGIMFSLYLMNKDFGDKRSIGTVLAYCAISLFFYESYDYTIHKKVFSSLVVYSFTSLFIASCFFSRAISSLKHRTTELRALYGSLVVAAIIDGLIMFVYFLNYLSFNRCANIFMREIVYKAFYGAILVGVIYLYTKIRSLKLNFNSKARGKHE